jgi:hypothetical protein
MPHCQRLAFPVQEGADGYDSWQDEKILDWLDVRGYWMLDSPALLRVGSPALSLDAPAL